MKEIGSEFWDVSPIGDINNKIFPSHTQWFLSGRTALNSIINDLENVKTVALPSWCCESIIKPFIDARIEVRFYSVHKNLQITQEPRFDCDAILIMDYFGYTKPTLDLGDYKGVVIRDMTHSIFSKSYSDADYYFGSLRKWCGVYTGGYAWTEDGHQLSVNKEKNEQYVQFRQKAMTEKRRYIESGYKNEKDFLNIYSEAETILDNDKDGIADQRDIKLAKLIDVKRMKQVRKANAKILQSAFNDWLMFTEDIEDDCPMFVPILVPNNKRDALRKYLIDNNIYCPIHWPISKYHKLEEDEMFLYKNVISIICDQRYEDKDMNTIVETINKFWEDE